MYKENDDAEVARPFRLCERCGRPTPANLSQCVNCGAISIQSVVAEEEDRSHQERRQNRAADEELGVHDALAGRTSIRAPFHR